MPDTLLAVRNKIASEFKEKKKIVDNKDFRRVYGKLWSGDTLKTAPKGFEKDHPALEYLKLRSFIAGHTVKEEKVLSKNYADYTAKVFKTVKPLNDFLNNAIGI